MAQTAYAYLVTADMCDLAVIAARQLDETDRFRRDMLPTEAGFMVFDRGLEFVDVRGDRNTVHHALWGPGFGGVVLHVFTDRAREPAEERLVRYLAYEKMAGRALTEQDRERIDAVFARRVGTHHDYLALQFYEDGIMVGPPKVPLFTNLVEELAREHVEAVEPDNILRFMFTVWRLFGQTITNISEATTSRHARKRARRARIPDRVTVIDLRRLDALDGIGEGGHVEWSHRWYSRGHWAWRRCSEHHSLAEPDPRGGWRARVWVRESIKGPADKPLVITDKVYRLKR